MFIKSLTIKNFKCFKNETIKFKTPDGSAGSGLNIFVGENGSGKTTALEAINLLTQSRLKTKSQLSIKDFNDFEEQIEIEAETKKCFNVQRIWGGKNFDANGFYFYAKIRSKDDKTSLLDPLVFDNKVVSSDSSIKEVEKRIEVDNPYGSRLPDFKIIFLDKNQTRHIKSGDWFKTKIDNVFDDFNFQFLKNFKDHEKLRSLNDNARENFLKQKIEKDGELINVVDDKILKEFMEVINEKLGISDLKLDFIEILQPFSSAFFAKRTGDEYRQILIEKLGSGIEILFAFLLLDKIYSFGIDNIIYCIDESEIHLHPQFQKKFLDILKELSKTKQIFISTHSPYFIDPNLIANVFRFESQPKQGAKTYKISEPEKSRELFHLENREIFFARKVLLVEGFEDRIRFRKFLGKHDMQDFFVIQGLRYKRVSEKICKDLNISFKTVVDLDYLFDGFPPDLNEDELQKITEYKELEKILPSIEAQNEILGKFLKEKILPKILKTTDQNGNKIKLCPSSKMIEKIKGDSDYKKRVKEKIEELKSENIFVLNYGMLENYLDQNGNLRNDDGKKNEKEKELKNIFEIK